MAGVIKNAMVRVGADLSGLISGFKKGASSIKSFSKMAASEMKTLSQEVEKMESAYATISKATERVNIGTPISKQIAALEKDRNKLISEAEKLGNTIAYWSDIEPIGAQFKTDEASNQLDKLDQQIRNITVQIVELQNVADLGKELGLDDVSSKHLKELQKNIQSAKQRMTELSATSEETKNKVNNNTEGLLKSIKRLGVVSLSLRFVRSIFGELGSIVRQYISENEALQVQVNALKSSFGQALAPAINVVTNALAKMMPYIQAVSNAISSLITNLFGSGWTTVAAGATAATKAIGGAGGAADKLKRSLQGFDEITKLNDSSSGGGGSSASSAAASIEGALPTWIANLTEQVKQSIETGDWSTVGETLSTKLSEVIADLDLTVLMKNLPSLQKSLTTFFEGWFSGLSWDSIGEFLKTNIEGFFENLDLGSVFQPGIKAAFLGNPIAQAMVDGLFENISEYFAPYIDALSGEYELVGEQIVVGILMGMADAVLSVGKWIKSYILDPIVEGFKDAFQIHSPAEHPEIRSIGKNIILGVFEGILEIAKSPLAWIKENVFTPIQQAMQNLFDGTALAKFTVGVKNTATVWWNDVKTWWAQKITQPVKSFTTGVKNEASDWWQSVKDWWAQKVGQVQTFKTSVKNDASAWWQSVKNWWSEAVDSVTFGAAIRNDAATWWNNAKTWWNNTIGSVTFGAKLRDDAATWWNNLKKWWNEKIGTLELKIKLPKIEVEWGQLSALGQTFNYPKSFNIKWNATGAILNGAQLFGMLGNTFLGGGEAGREALLPLDRHTGWMDDIADRVAAKMGSAGAGEQTITVNVPLDGKVLASTVVRIVNNQARTTGHNPLSAWI